MKKIISIALCLLFVFSISACTDKTSSIEDNSNDSSDAIVSNQTPNDSLSLPNEYDVIINNIINAYPWNDDVVTMVPGNPELSYLYLRNSSLSEIGFALVDLDNNGVDELIITGINSPFIYDLYTLSNGKAVHLFANGEKYAHYLYKDGWVELQWSSSAAVSGHDFYEYSNGKLDFIERITLDADHALDVGVIDDLIQANEDTCYFKSSSEKVEDYISITADEAIKAIKTHQKKCTPLQIEYTLLSEYKQ